MVMVILGRPWATLFGPVIGAVAYSGAGRDAYRGVTEYWAMIMGPAAAVDRAVRGAAASWGLLGEV